MDSCQETTARKAMEVWQELVYTDTTHEYMILVQVM